MGLLNSIKKSMSKKPQKPQRPQFYDIVCPFCFEKFSPEAVVFRASHSREDDDEFMLSEDELLNKYRNKFKIDKTWYWVSC